jgi:hypothetical protein
MKYETTENGCLMFYPESGDFLHSVLSVLHDDTNKFFYPTGSGAFFGLEYVQGNSDSDFDFLILGSDWGLLVEQPFFIKNYEEEIREFNSTMEKHYANFLEGTDYNDNKNVETWNVLINYQNKLTNIIICQTKDVFRKWKFATVSLINLCRNEKMKYLLMNNKEKRVDLFKQFKEMFRLGFIEEIPF